MSVLPTWEQSQTDHLNATLDRYVRLLDEALDEVERLRGVIDRLEIEKHDLAERLMRQSSDPT